MMNAIGQMPPVEIYTTRYCPYCVAAKALLTRKGIAFTEIDVSGNYELRQKMVERAHGRMTVPQIFIGTMHVGGSDDLHALEAAKKLDRLAGERREVRMTAATFTAALVQMRSGLKPQANLDAAVKLIGEAKDRGADYVQTPEMTNIMVLQHEHLFAAIVAEENDPASPPSASWRARSSIHLHIGSLAIRVSADKAANRSFLIDPKGEIAARYDKIHMFDVDLANGESYRESRNYRAGDFGVVADLPWGRLGLTICYDLRFPGALSRAGGSRRVVPRDSRRPSPGRPARRIGMCCSAPAPSRTAASSSPPRKAASMRTAARPSAIH